MLIPLIGILRHCLSDDAFEFDTGCFADVNGDNVVGIEDLLIVLADWGPCRPECPGDVTANGTVGIWDLLNVLKHWGPCDP